MTKFSIVMTALLQAGFAINKSKLEVDKQELKFHGHLISGDAIKPDPDKLKVVQEMPRPTNVPELRCVLGICTYLSRFVSHFSSLTAPLRELLKEKNHFSWGAEQENAFQKIKQALLSPQVLKPFDPEKPVQLATDASDTGLGAVLIQDGHPIAYAARSLAGPELRYSAIETELLAVVFALDRFRFYTKGRQVTIMTDHKPLLGLVHADMEKLTPRLRRMVEKIFDFTLEWTYVPGKTNFLPDLLSRLTHHQVSKPDLSDIEEAAFVSTVDLKFVRHLLGGGPFFLEMEKASKNDPVFNRIREFMQYGWPKKITSLPPELRPYWSTHHDIREAGPFLVTGKDQVCVPAEMLTMAIWLAHVGHPGIQATTTRLKQLMYWPGMGAQVAQFVSNCARCLLKMPKHPKEPMRSDEVPTFPGKQVAADYFVFGDEIFFSNL